MTSSVNYEITIITTDLTAEMVKWYVDVGGKFGEEVWYTARGQKMITPLVAYGNGATSHRMQDGSGQYLIRFLGKDVGLALIFLMKFSNYIFTHNMKEEEKYAY